MEYHHELIKCPRCSKIQWAKIEHKVPWNSYFHICQKCLHDIMESDWDAIIPKILSLWQPWATLYACGVKLIETRPKETNYRGIYLIHAAKKWSKEQAEICIQEPFKSALEKLGYLHYNEGTGYKGYSFSFPMGALVGSVEVVSCHRIHNSIWSPIRLKPHYYGNTMNYIQEPEVSFGNYEDGRFVWISKHHKPLIEPVPYKGSQGYYMDFKGDKTQIKFAL